MGRSRSPRRRRQVDASVLKSAVEKAYAFAQPLTQGAIYSSQNVPGLSDADPDPFVVSITMLDGWTLTLASRSVTSDLQRYESAPGRAAIETSKPLLPLFLIQSTFKPLVYALGLEKAGASTVHRSVGSAGGFGYGAFETLPDGRAPNPLINAGALTLLERLGRLLTEDEISEFCCTLGDPVLAKTRCKDEWHDAAAIAATEADSIRNRGLCCFLASRAASGSTEILPKTEMAVNSAVRLYCVADCLKMNTEHLARIAAVFANSGYSPESPGNGQQKRLLSAETVSMTLSQMLSAGMYEASGDWSREVGIPAKSGVSGALMCVVPSVCGICVYSPKIDNEGNSVRGMSFVRELVSQLPQLSVFSSEYP